MDPEKLKVVDLRKELQQRGLDTKGNKAVLVKRLRDALDAEAEADSAESTEQDPLETADKQETEPDQPEKKPAKEEPQVIKKEPATASPKKEVVPETPKKQIVKEEAKSPVKVVKVEPKKYPVKADIPETPSEESGKQKISESQKDEQPTEKMETETRGEKRKRDDDDDETEEIENKEKKRREHSPAKSAKSPEKTPVKEKREEKLPPKEDEPEIDYDKAQLSWFDSDLHLKIDKNNFLSAKPNNEGCFGYVWAGARGTHGISVGKACFEVKITEELKWEDPAEKMQEKNEKSLKDRYKIDRRKEKSQTKSDEKTTVAEGENDKDKSEGQNDESAKNGEKSDEKMETEESKDGEPKSSETSEVEKEGAPQETATDEDKEDAAKAVEDKEVAEKKDEDKEGAEKEEKEENEPKAEEKPKLPPIPTHYFRVGFSLIGTSLQLGETKYSYAYESTGKFITDKEFRDYGVTFGVGDVVGAYLSIDDKNVSITFTVNGVSQTTAITVPRSEFPQENVSLFPHVLCRNYAYEVNFGALEEPWFPHPDELKGYQFVQAVEEKVVGPKRPEKREECEVLLMIGLPGSGKTHWVKNHIASTTDKYYTVIGNNPLFDRMTVEGQPMKSRFGGSWKILVDRIQKCLNQLTDMAALRRRNYIIDQTNVFPNAQRRKLRVFDGFKRKAVIVVCEDDEHARRQKDQQNDYGKTVPETTMYDLKAQMELPEKCEWIEELVFPDLNEEEAKKKVKEYNEDANKNGYFKRWQTRQNDRRNVTRGGFRGARRGPGFGGSRFDRFSRGPGWNRPGWGGRDTRGPPPRPAAGAPWRDRFRGSHKFQDQNRSRDTRPAGGYSSDRNQGGGRNINPWQGNSGGYNNWGSGGSHGGKGWNANMYGSQGFGAWNQGQAAQQSAWKYGATQSNYGSGQGQRGYGGNQGGYGNNQGGYGNNQSGYSSQTGYGGNQGGYNNASQGSYGGQGGYGQQNWNYYGQYGQQQQGWGAQGQSKPKSGGYSANYSQQDWAKSAQQYAQQQWPQNRRQ